MQRNESCAYTGEDEPCIRSRHLGWLLPAQSHRAKLIQQVTELELEVKRSIHNLVLESLRQNIMPTPPPFELVAVL